MKIIMPSGVIKYTAIAVLVQIVTIRYFFWLCSPKLNEATKHSRVRHWCVSPSINQFSLCTFILGNCFLSMLG